MLKLGFKRGYWTTRYLKWW